MRKHIFLGLVLLTSLSSCSFFEMTYRGPELVFGRYYGECVGDECIVIFRLTEEELQRAVDPAYPGNEQTGFDYRATNELDFNYAKILLDAVPETLIEITDNVLGCPDCADQGGILIEYKDGVSNFRRWRIDLNKSELPKEIHNFVDLINEKVDGLLLG